MLLRVRGHAYVWKETQRACGRRRAGVCAHVYVHMCVGEVDDIESDFINHPDTDKLPMHPHTANGQPLRSVSVSCGV